MSDTTIFKNHTTKCMFGYTVNFHTEKRLILREATPSSSRIVYGRSDRESKHAIRKLALHQSYQLTYFKVQTYTILQNCLISIQIGNEPSSMIKQEKMR